MVMIALMKEFITLYKDQPYFYWSFFNELSHGLLNEIGTADGHYYEFFKEAYSKGMHNIYDSL